MPTHVKLLKYYLIITVCSVISEVMGTSHMRDEQVGIPEDYRPGVLGSLCNVKKDWSGCGDGLRCGTLKSTAPAKNERYDYIGAICFDLNDCGKI